MKRAIIFSLFAILLASCTQKTVTINGHFDESLNQNGQMVVLYVEQSDTVISYSQEIVDNSFSFTQTNQKDQFTSITLGEFGDFLFFLEEGTINIDVVANNDTLSPSVAHINYSGTPNNELLTEFNDMDNAISEALAAAETKEEADAVLNEMMDGVFTFFYTNINTLAGRKLCRFMWRDLSLEQKKALRPAMNEETLEEYKDLYFLLDQREATEVGNPYVDFEVETITGDTLSVKSLIGETDYVLIDFWATWCRPCRELLPKLLPLYKEFAPTKHLQIISVSVDESSEDWHFFVGNHPEYNWIQTHTILDVEDGAVLPHEYYGIQLIPSTILIDKDGMIVSRSHKIPELLEILQ